MCCMSTKVNLCLQLNKKTETDGGSLQSQQVCGNECVLVWWTTPLRFNASLPGKGFLWLLQCGRWITFWFTSCSMTTTSNAQHSCVFIFCFKNQLISLLKCSICPLNAMFLNTINHFFHPALGICISRWILHMYANIIKKIRTIIVLP